MSLWWSLQARDSSLSRASSALRVEDFVVTKIGQEFQLRWLCRAKSRTDETHPKGCVLTRKNELEVCGVADHELAIHKANGPYFNHSKGSVPGTSYPEHHGQVGLFRRAGRIAAPVGLRLHLVELVRKEALPANVAGQEIRPKPGQDPGQSVLLIQV